jgi:hypothetical protein
VIALLALLGAASGTSSSPAVAGEVVSAAVLIYVLWRQRQVRAVQTKLLLPLALAIVGLVSVVSDAKVHALSAGQGAVLIALLLGDAIGLGVVRAFTVRLWHADGQTVRQEAG